ITASAPEEWPASARGIEDGEAEGEGQPGSHEASRGLRSPARGIDFEPADEGDPDLALEVENAREPFELPRHLVGLTERGEIAGCPREHVLKIVQRFDARGPKDDLRVVLGVERAAGALASVAIGGIGGDAGALDAEAEAPTGGELRAAL